VPFHNCNAFHFHDYDYSNTSPEPTTDRICRDELVVGKVILGWYVYSLVKVLCLPCEGGDETRTKVKKESRMKS
jgi:hypothetical protein